MSDQINNAAGARDSLLTEHDIYLFKQGSHFKLYEKLGSHCGQSQGRSGVHFAVWAPNARTVSVVGDFNQWRPDAHYLYHRQDESGIWEGFIPDIGHGTLYKYHIVSNLNSYTVDKGDPYARFWQQPPDTASVVWHDSFRWDDGQWMAERGRRNALTSPISIYEVHLGSWRRRPDEPQRFLNYRELAHELADHACQGNFTHVELMPVMEHPFYGSWGYQVLGYYAPTSRYGTPDDFRYLVDHLHRRGLGVILDWVPSHFPSNEYGLTYFDGSHLYEHADPRRGWHPDWNSYIFNLGRNEVRAFLISNAIFWLDEFHADALRVDAVASMLYLDYSRKEGDWVPNAKGGRENLEAISFLRRMNEVVYEMFPSAQTIAEESTSWPMVSKPAYTGGLGFGLKWNMGWMHDTLNYFAIDPLYRNYHHNEITFSIWYAFAENFVLAISHDEVVHGKGSILGRMPGDPWQKFANMRLLWGYMMTHPGKKLNFMGTEIGQWSEWNHDTGLDWPLLEYPLHAGLWRFVQDANALLRTEPALYECDFDHRGFEWVSGNDSTNSVLSYLRRGNGKGDVLLAVCNFTPLPRYNYRLGVPQAGFWQEILNSDAWIYGGSNQGNFGGQEASPVAYDNRFQQSLSLTLPPLAALVFKPAPGGG